MIAMPEMPLRTDEGGVIRVGKSRVTLQAVVADFQRGASPEAITHHYPSLNLAEVYLVIAYYLQNRPTVEQYINEQRQLAADARREHEADHPQDALRAYLLTQLDEQREK